MALADDSGSGLKLYGYGPSRSARCLWMLRELGVPFEYVQVDLGAGEHLGAEYRRLNPFGRVPTLTDGDVTFFESAAICTYLGDRFPQKGLVPPAGTAERALHDQWMFFVVSELDQPLWRIRRNRNLYPEAERVPADIERARKDFCEAGMVLQDALAGRSCLVGERLTAVDIVAAHTLLWSTWYDLLEGFDGLRAYMERLLQREACPSFLRLSP